jgi:8-oxo-dGTP pyrophosphatase MutT (NUDIX family)
MTRRPTPHPRTHAHKTLQRENHVPQPDAPTSSLPPATDSMTLLVAAVIVHDRDAGQVVLLQRGPNAKFAPGSWDLPVGKSTPGEPITTTAVRELREETGIIVDPADLQVAHVIHSSFGVEAPNGFLTIVFAAHRWTGVPQNLEPAKHAQASWVDVESVPEDFVETTKFALDCYLSGGPMISISGWKNAGSSTS